MPDDGLWRAIIFARSNKTYATSCDVDNYLRRLLSAAMQIGLHTKAIGSFRRRDLLAVLDRMGELRPWTAHTWNHCLGYLSGIFSHLIVYEAMESNPVRGIPKRGIAEKVRATLTRDERRRIDSHLKANHRRFWLFVQMFFHSGVREVELLRVKRSDVNLDDQTYIVTVRKGRMKVERQDVKAIKDVALPFWKEYLQDAGEGEYLFGKGWTAASRPLSRDWVTHLWGRIVKDGLGIEADLYSLKHLNYDETDALLGADAAAAQAGHTSTKMRKHYAVNAKAREMERIRKLENSFA